MKSVFEILFSPIDNTSHHYRCKCGHHDVYGIYHEGEMCDLCHCVVERVENDSE